MKDFEKYLIRRELRAALVEMNAKTIFSCHECICCVPRDGDEIGVKCHAEMIGYPSDQRLSAHMMRECFSYNYMDSPLVNVLNKMAELGINFHDATHGWPTVVNRMLQRLDRFGQNILIKRYNLERFR